MAETTKIEWCDSTWNPWIGCTQVSPACDHCYAAASTPARTLGIEWGAGKPRQRTSPGNWKLPELWDRKPFAECSACGWRGERTKILDNNGYMIGWGSHCPACKRAGQTLVAARRRVFCASLADVFDNEVPAVWLADLLSLIASTPSLDWLLLTKRIGNWHARLEAAVDCFEHRLAAGRGDNAGYAMARNWLLGLAPANVWIGATICNQAEADRDVPKLLRVPAAVRFLSIEPMLGPIDLRWFLRKNVWEDGRPVRGCDYGHGTMLDWVIAGGESGPHARPMHPDWARSLRDQCAAAGVPFLFKQHGEWIGVPDLRNLPEGGGPGFGAYDHCPHDMDAEAVRVGKKAAGRKLDGRIHHEFPPEA